MKRALVFLLVLCIFTLSALANLTVYEAISLGQLHGAEDAGSRGFTVSILFGAIGAALSNQRWVSVPASRLAYVRVLTNDREAIKAYEESYQNAYRKTVAANTWHGYTIASLIVVTLNVLLVFLTMLSGY
jgi:hypothetical protein